MSLAGVLIRSRARQTPSAIRVSSSPSTSAGQFEPDVLGVLLAVAGEAIGAEREGERREPRVVRAHWRSGSCRPAGGSDSVPAETGPRCGSSAASSPNRTPARPPSGEGQDQVPAGLRLEAGRASAKALGGESRPRTLVGPGRGGDERNRNGGRLSAREKCRVHGGIAHKWPSQRRHSGAREAGTGASVNTS